MASSHSRTASDASTVSAASSELSSPPASDHSHSVNSMVPPFKNSVNDYYTSKTRTDDELYHQATVHLRVLTDPKYSEYDFNRPAWVRTIARRSPEFSLNRFIEAMYGTADELSLRRGKRYVSAAICACASYQVKQGDNTDGKVKQLAANLSLLVATWVSYMLWPFVPNTTDHPHLAPSRHVTLQDAGLATPTIQSIAEEITDGAGPVRGGTMRDDVLKRDKYRCFMSGVILENKEHLYSEAELESTEAMVNVLEVAHIFRRSVAVFDTEGDQEKYKSRLNTLDILQHYCELDHSIVVNIADIIDSPANGFTLQLDRHDGFDKFMWRLLKVDDPRQPGTYKIDVLPRKSKRFNLGTKHISTMVTFRDHSSDVDAAEQAHALEQARAIEQDNAAEQGNEPGGSGSVQRTPRTAAGKRGRSIDLPHPELIRLHAALAGVLHMSGAAEVLADLHESPPPDGPRVASEDGAALYKVLSDEELMELHQAVAGMKLPRGQVGPD